MVLRTLCLLGLHLPVCLCCIDVIDPLLLNASLLLVVTTDYSDWLLQITAIIHSWQWRSLLSFDDCVIE